jgi:hypothetical protein
LGRRRDCLALQPFEIGEVYLIGRQAPPGAQASLSVWAESTYLIEKIDAAD